MGKEALPVGFQAWPRIADFLDPIGVEERRCGRTVCKREGVAQGPRPPAQFLIEPIVGDVQPFAGALHSIRIARALRPQRITNDPDYRTVQIGLRSLSSSNPDRLNLITAGTVIAAVPIVIVLIIFQRQLIRGLTAGAVKG